MGEQTIQRRNTRQRKLVLDAVRAHHDHPTADDIYNDVVREDPRVSRGTVYRNLRLLEETGTIRCINAPGSNRFDWRVDDHVHAACRLCGRVVDVALPYDSAADAAVSRETGFSVTSHSTLFEGICPECQRKLAEQAEAEQD